MFEIADGLVVDPWKVSAVKKVGDGKSAVFLDGQSPIDGGFTIDKDYIEAATDVLEARQEDDEEPDEEDETEAEEDEE